MHGKLGTHVKGNSGKHLYKWTLIMKDAEYKMTTKIFTVE